MIREHDEMRKIAIEEHWTNEYFLHLRMEWMKEAGIYLTLSHEELQRITALVQDVQFRIKEMDRLGITQQILISGSNGTEGIRDGERAALECRKFNDACAEIIKSYPNRFKAFAVLPYQCPELAAAELERCMGQEGFVGARLSGYVNGHFIDEKRFWPIFEKAGQLGACFYLHPTETPLIASKLYEGCEPLLGSSWSWGVDTATYLLRIILSGIFDAYPNVSVILGHLGEMLPYIIWRLDHRLQTMPDKANISQKASEYLKKNVYISTSGNLSESALRCAIDTLGADRIMFSVDYPYEDMEQAVRFMEQAAITEDERKKIFYENAEKYIFHKGKGGNK